MPWGLLYVGDASEGAALDWDNFIGMRHVIEQIPLQTSMSVSDSSIRSDNPKLSVSVNVNTTIDTQMHAHFVSQQRLLGRRAQSGLNLRLVTRGRSSEFKRALASAATDDQILYLYCHAEAAGLNDPGGPDASSLVSSDARVTLGDLNLDAPTDTQLRGNPLVFINACESAQMSPAFYDGFVPYFMAKGARGVVGTECQTPALFAAEWAKRFFERFLAGEVLGEVFLGLRQEFLTARQPARVDVCRALRWRHADRAGTGQGLSASTRASHEAPRRNPSSGHLPRLSSGAREFGGGFIGANGPLYASASTAAATGWAFASRRATPTRWASATAA